jgi:succinate-acetate transporter protein
LLHSISFSAALSSSWQVYFLFSLCEWLGAFLSELTPENMKIKMMVVSWWIFKFVCIFKQIKQTEEL